MMMGALTIILMIAEYIITSNNVYINLDEFYDDFVIEAKIINEAKCIAANTNSLEDFYIDEGLVSVYPNGSDYLASFNGITYKIIIEENMITYYSVE